MAYFRVSLIKGYEEGLLRDGHGKGFKSHNIIFLKVIFM